LLLQKSCINLEKSAVSSDPLQICSEVHIRGEPQTPETKTWYVKLLLSLSFGFWLSLYQKNWLSEGHAITQIKIFHLKSKPEAPKDFCQIAVASSLEPNLPMRQGDISKLK